MRKLICIYFRSQNHGKLFITDWLPIDHQSTGSILPLEKCLFQKRMLTTLTTHKTSYSLCSVSLALPVLRINNQLPKCFVFANTWASTSLSVFFQASPEEPVLLHLPFIPLTLVTPLDCSVLRQPQHHL